MKPGDVPFIVGLASLAALNVTDAALTTHFVGLGLAYEFNPLMRYFLDISPLAFCLAKFSIVVPMSLVLWLIRDKPNNRIPTLITLAVANAIYGLNFIYQLLVGVVLLW